jgi:predicted O-methyltransferase YrrM
VAGIRRVLGTLFQRLAPAPIRNARTRAVLLRRARDLAHRSQGIFEPAGLWTLLREYPEFLPLQRDSEIVRLLDLVRRAEPRRVCEIGTAAGGTAFLLSRMCRPGATLVTLDLALRPGQAEALELLGGAGCRVVALTGDSHDAAVLDRVRDAAGGPLDFLFIDGDHRYAGVAGDFERFLPLVRPGGVIAFHDIMPDSRSRGGPDTGTDAGGVPQFWRELVARFPGATSEFIERTDQDACGIGIFRVLDREDGEE